MKVDKVINDIMKTPAEVADEPPFCGEAALGLILIAAIVVLLMVL